MPYPVLPCPPCPDMKCHSMPWPEHCTLVCPLAIPSTLLCPLACSPPYRAPRRVLRPGLPLCCPPPMGCAMSFTMRCCSSRLTNRFAFTPSLYSACPALRSTLPLLCIHLDFYLCFLPPCTQLCTCPVFILTPDLRSAPVCATLPYSISLLCHLCAIILSSLSRCPPALALHYELPLCSLLLTIPTV